MSQTIVGYVREGAGLPPLDEQRAAVLAWAAELGLGLTEIHSDEVVTLPADLRGERPARRAPSLAGAVALLDDAAADPGLTIIVATLAALERDDLPELGRLPAIVLEVGHDRPPPRPLPKEPRMTDPAILLQGRRRQAARGIHQCGPAPYGYRRERNDFRRTASGESYFGSLLVPEPEEARAVRVIFEQYLRLESIRRLSAWLARQGLRTRRGHPWTLQALNWILRNETYLGRVRLGDIRAPGLHQPLVSVDLFARVQERLRSNDKRGAARAAAREVAA